MGKHHGTLAKAGKVRKQTPKVDKEEKAKKVPKGRGLKRQKFNKRYANVVVAVGGRAARKPSPNANAGRKIEKK